MSMRIKALVLAICTTIAYFALKDSGADESVKNFVSTSMFVGISCWILSLFGFFDKKNKNQHDEDDDGFIIPDDGSEARDFFSGKKTSKRKDKIEDLF